SEQAGYLWSFPRPDHLAVGVCAPVTARAGAPALRAQSLAWITSQMFDPGCRLEPYAWPIPSVRVTRGRHPRVSGPGWMLLGDAAGLVDPLTREGIYFALLSAAWAAEELAHSSARPGDRFEDRLNDEVYPELDRANELSPVFFSRAFGRLLVTA